MVNQNKKRHHHKSQGLILLKELAEMVTKNYNKIEDKTQCFVRDRQAVGLIL